MTLPCIVKICYYGVTMVLIWCILLIVSLSYSTLVLVTIVPLPALAVEYYCNAITDELYESS